MLQVAFLPIDKWRRLILQNPELYLGGVAEPFWLNSLGAAVWVGEQVFVGRWVKKYYFFCPVWIRGGAAAVVQLEQLGKS